MTRFEDLERLAEKGEGMNVEFKENLSVEVIKGLSTDLAAFANTTGGIVVVGIDNSDTIVGYQPKESDRNRISQEAGNCKPPVLIDFERLNLRKKHFLIVSVPKSSGFHCDKKYRYPVRVGNITSYLDPAGIVVLVKNRLFS